MTIWFYTREAFTEDQIIILNGIAYKVIKHLYRTSFQNCFLLKEKL